MISFFPISLTCYDFLCDGKYIRQKLRVEELRIINNRCIYTPEINYRNSSLLVYVISVKCMQRCIWGDIKFFVKLVRDL